METIKTLYNKYKQIIIQTAPSYIKHDDAHSSLTSKLLNVRRKIGFTRIFYPGTHLEGEIKIFDRRYKNTFFKYNRLLGARGEVFYIFVFFFLLKKITSYGLEREKIEEKLVDRDVFFLVKLNDSSTKIN